MKNQYIIVGSGGHGHVILDILQVNRTLKFAGWITKEKDISREKNELYMIYSDEDLPDLYKKSVKYAAIGIGSVKSNRLRNKLYKKCKDIGFTMINAVHHSAIISREAKLPENQGVQIMAAVKINNGVIIKENVVLNTGSIIEHNCLIEKDSYIATGAVLSGSVRIKKNCFIGAGTIIKQEVTVGANSIIGAGSLVLNNIPENSLAYGSPARFINNQ